jgi:hypothetical protein
MKNTIKNALIFAVAILPVGIASGILFVIDYHNRPVYMQEDVLAQVGSYGMFVLISFLQSIVFACILGFLGYILSEKVGLMRRFTFAKKATLISIVAGIVLGVAMLSTDAIFVSMGMPTVDTGIEGFDPTLFVLALLYGGIIEEVASRLFLMSLVALIIWKLFFKKATAENIPAVVFMIANLLVAIPFAAGHLVGGLDLFPEVNVPLFIIRVLLINSGMSIAFGCVYQKYGIHYAMLCHAMVHVTLNVVTYAIL